ncbi:MAG: MBL fold metallo-hydrolase [Oscillospiraceae bacterium]|nr:MBL fold metallo-hydrolase [Oscillospiraceae bacterium]
MHITLGIDDHETQCRSWRAGEGIYAIRCPGYLPGPGRLPGWGYVLSYLVTGSERALLIDTGFGISDLAAYVRTLTDLPLTVVNTHIHPDHSGGNGQFDEVWVGEHETADTQGVLFYQIPGQRDACAAVKAGGGYRFRFLRDAETLDLGGRRLRVVEIPGHTAGSIALFDERTRLLLCGDAILKRVFYGAGVPLSVYRAALERTKRLPLRDILSAHWPEPLGADFIDKMLRLIDAFDPAQAERAAWGASGMAERDMRMFCFGRDFDDPDFVALSFFMDQLDQIMR